MHKFSSEYLRRNILLAKAIGANANAEAALWRIRQGKRAPEWLVANLQGIVSRTAALVPEIAQWRNEAIDR